MIYVYFQLMAQYQYHAEATIEYRANSLEKFHCDTDVFSPLCTSQSTKNDLKVLKKLLAFDILEELVSAPGWNILFTATKRCHIDDDTMQIMSNIVQNFVN